MEFFKDIITLSLMVEVVSSDGTSTSFSLEEPNYNDFPSMSLDQMREYLYKKGLIIGRQNTNFRNVSGSKLSLAREPECKLKDILTPTNEQVQDGFFTFYLDKDLEMPSFPEIVQNLNLDKGCKKLNDGTIIATKKKAYSIKNQHMMEVVIENKLEQHSIEHTRRKILVCKKGFIRLLQEDLEPTEEYITAVKNALKCNDNPSRRDALNRVGEEYGYFWPKETRLGGKFFLDDDQENNLDELRNLKNFQNWQIIEQPESELLPLFNLLPQDLILKIKEVIGMTLLYSSHLTIHISTKCGSKTMNIPKPNEISTFKNVKIFTSVIIMNNQRPYRNVFGIRVEYMDDEHPYVVVHRIGPARKFFNLSIPYMLIGYPEDLPIGPLSEFPIDYIWTKECQFNRSDSNIHITEHPSLDFYDYCWIGTCTLRCNNNQSYNFGRSKDVISYHFRRNQPDNATNICCYQYDLLNEQIKHTLNFEINYVIIVNTPGLFRVFNPVNHNLKYRSCRPEFLLRNSRTFTGERWQLDPFPTCIFASIHCSDDDNPFLLNIHKKYPIVRSLGNVSQNLNTSIGYVITMHNSTNYRISQPENTNQKTNMKNKISQPENTNQETNIKNIISQPENTNQGTNIRNKISKSENKNQETNIKNKIPQSEKSENINQETNIKNQISHLINQIKNEALSFKINHGFIINSQTMHAAANPAFDIKLNPNINFINNYEVKITSTKNRKETFLLENNIDSSSFLSLPPKLINIMKRSTSTDWLNNNSPVNDTCIEIKCQKVVLDFERETMRPTEELTTAINKALNNQRPYQELIKVFIQYGYILSQKIILGEKLYETLHLSLQEQNFNGQKLEIKELFLVKLSKLSKLDELFTLLKSNYGFDIKYLMSTYGEAIKKEDIKKWIEVYFEQDFKTLQIINQDKLFPLYKIFKEPICSEIESILGINNENKILMTGIEQIIEDTKYYHISFSDHLNSSNYQIFAKIVRINENSNEAISIDIAFVKIQSETRTGFLAIIENFDRIKNIDLSELHIMWMLVGLPDEINFFSIHTRKLSILSMENRQIESKEASILLKIPENFSQTSIISLSFEYLLTFDKILSQKHEIKLDIDYGPSNSNIYSNESSGSESDDASNNSEESQESIIKYSLNSCIFISEEVFIEADIPRSKNKLIYVKAMGLPIN
ncbi:712_t:CDS:2 [Scutellospora calospora]|uniref:712_t:CDS:1 n=1 Tax=Scutellospora calospora TaxID=85575 RepID=A0ACA9KR24_9GLOM|nr:712_t:CDS:2 [Scutellospora calospora]